MQVSIDFYPMSVAKPVKTGKYLAVNSRDDGILYIGEREYSAKWGAFDCHDLLTYSEEELERLMSSQPVYWAEIPSFIRQKGENND